MPFERPHHQRIGRVLESLDASTLREEGCLFGGGTVIALRFGEYLESVDIDFLVADLPRFRDLRLALTGEQGLAAIVRQDAQALQQVGALTADQYGIRTRVAVDGQAIKLEIVYESRIPLDGPGRNDEVCGVATLTPQDMVASKLLANSDRWGDEGVFSRDLIDLAMMRPNLQLLRNGVAKAQVPYGAAILRDLARAIDRMQNTPGWLERCLQAMAMQAPPAAVWQRIRALRRVTQAA